MSLSKRFRLGKKARLLRRLWVGGRILLCLTVPLSVTVEARFSRPVVSVDPPTATDYIITGAGTLTAAVQNVKAFQADLVLSASGGDVTVTEFRLNGTHLTDEQRIRVPAENAASVAEIGRTGMDEGASCRASAHWALIVLLMTLG